MHDIPQCARSGTSACYPNFRSLFVSLALQLAGKLHNLFLIKKLWGFARMAEWRVKDWLEAIAYLVAIVGGVAAAVVYAIEGK